MSEKTLGRVAYGAYWSERTDAETDAFWKAHGQRGWDAWEAAATAARADLVAEVERLNAECCRLAGELVAAKVCGAEEYRWEQQHGRHVLFALRPVEVAGVIFVGAHEPLVRWFVAGDEHEYGFAATLEKAKAHAELAAGVSRD